MSEKKEVATPDFCGLIMPISEIDGCSESHWLDVKAILTESIETCGLKANLVSNSDEIGIIQKRIVEHLYQYTIAVCDVSGKNPNVMFELGIRLTFDKPVIIVKDDQTSYSFDTSPIEHLTYPRDLRFAKIVSFQKELRERLQKTLKKANEDLNYSPFLRAFGEFSVPKIPQKEVTGQEFIMQQLDSINLAISRLARPAGINPRPGLRRPLGDGDICLRGYNAGRQIEIEKLIQDLPFVQGISRYDLDQDHAHFSIDLMPHTNSSDIELLKGIAPRTKISRTFKPAS